MKFIQTHGLLILLFLAALSLLNGCGANAKLSKLQKQVDSLNAVVISQQQMMDIIKTTPAWKTLSIEELSDKEHIPISHYQNEEEKK